MEKLIDILTSDDKAVIKQAIIDIVIEKIKDDLDDYSKDVYFLAPDIHDMLAEAFNEAEEKFKKYVSKYYFDKLKGNFIKMEDGK